MPQLFSGPRPARRRSFVALLAVLAVLGALLSALGQSSSARADGGTASVSGTVTDASTGAPLGGVTVSITSDDYTYLDAVTTADDGTYTLGTIPAGNYTLQFAPASGTNYVQLCWKTDNCVDNNPTYFPIADGDQLTGYDAALQPGSTMTGTVVSNGVGVANVAVNLDSDDGNTAGAVTDADGNYTVIGIAPDDYQVDFQPQAGNYLEQWWNNQPTQATAQYVTVGAGATVSGIDASLVRGGVITGTVTDANGPVQGVFVDAIGPGSALGQATTNAQGVYRMASLPPGSYTVEFTPSKKSGDALQYWNSANTQASATPIDVEGNTTRGVDATLAAGASIQGRVLAPGTPNTPVPNALVEVYPASGGQNIASSYTNANGVYRVAGLPAGSYSVRVVPPYGAAMAPEWWGGTFIQTGAKTLDLSVGEAATHISQRLIVGAVISGTIFAGDTSTPEPFAAVQVYESDQIAGPNESFPPFERDTDSNGNYALPNLGPGTYTLFFGSEDPNVISQWWNGKRTQANATVVTVRKNVDQPGFNVTLAPAVVTPGTPTITGRAKVGATLTAHNGGWQPSGLQFSYQWLRNGSPIAHATGSTYTLTAVDLGSTISVVVTGSIANFESQGKTESVTSAPTAPVTN